MGSIGIVHNSAVQQIRKIALFSALSCAGMHINESKMHRIALQQETKGKTHWNAVKKHPQSAYRNASRVGFCVVNQPLLFVMGHTSYVLCRCLLLILFALVLVSSRCACPLVSTGTSQKIIYS